VQTVSPGICYYSLPLLTDLYIRVSRTRVKICGITRVEDALAAVAAGADALGFVFYRKSPRAVTGQHAADIVASLPAFVSTVGLFVDAEPEEVEGVLAQCPLDILQFHGAEDAAYCQRFGRPYLKALRMRDTVDVVDFAASHSGACGLLLDSYRPGVPGGTGEVFDWQRIPKKLSLPLVLAGGLRADNVESAIAECHPWAVDVSGGVESGAGIKCQQAVADFIAAVARADLRELSSES
jgi:phosphoribosylanthranilate isomerase